MDRKQLLDRKRTLEEEIYKLEQPIPIEKRSSHEQTMLLVHEMIGESLESMRQKDEARLHALRCELQTIDAELAALEPLGPENPIRWQGSASDLVELFAVLREKRIKVASQNELFGQIVQHFVGADGKAFFRDNLKRSLSSRRNFGSDAFASIPENKQSDSDKPRSAESMDSRGPAKTKSLREGKK